MHPDKLFTIDNIDRDESVLLDTILSKNESAQNATSHGHHTTGDHTSQASEHDKMIEFVFKNSKNSNLLPSATIIVISSFNEQHVIVAVVDLKSRKKNIKFNLKTKRKPNFLFQLDDFNLLVGTEEGFIEQWEFDFQLNQNLLKTEIQAHSGSQEGISSIIEVDTSSQLIRGSKETDSFSLIATACWNVNEFRIWKYNLESRSLSKHIKVDSSLDQGIKFLMQSSPTQIVAVDHDKCLKFYDFERKIDEFDEAVDAIWKSYDVSGDDVLNKQEA